MFQSRDPSSGFPSGIDQGPGSSSFDLNDFPSLGGSAGGNGLAQALRQQQQIMAQQQMMKSSASGNNMYRLAMTGQNQNFSMANEDFPALSGAPTSTSGPSSLLAGSTPQRNDSNGFGVQYDQDARGSRIDGGSALLGGAGLSGLTGLKGLPTQQASRPQVPMGSSAVGTALSGDYGLLGLLGIIRMTDSDRNALALGSDLTLLGLNVGSSEQLYNTFSGPWSEASATKEPHFQVRHPLPFMFRNGSEHYLTLVLVTQLKLPPCYYTQPPALKTGHLSKFQLETLFYIFYTLPKDVLQAYAAQELYAREWRYHGDSKLWFKIASAADGVSATPGSAQFMYFDTSSWERRLFNGNSQNLANGFLSEDDVRVKIPNS